MSATPLSRSGDRVFLHSQRSREEVSRLEFGIIMGIRPRPRSVVKPYKRNPFLSFSSPVRSKGDVRGCFRVRPWSSLGFFATSFPTLNRMWNWSLSTKLSLCFARQREGRQTSPTLSDISHARRRSRGGGSVSS